MKSKLTLFFFLAAMTVLSANASFPIRAAAVDRQSTTYVNDDISKLIGGSMEIFKKMTPKQYQKLTGKKLTLKETIKLKAAQKMLKRSEKRDSDISKELYIVLAILGFGWVAMGVMDDWKGSTWIVNLILTFCCWLPGVIHALVKMNDYFEDK
jgi:uncharacterized membrane protein YqaE (UPF0057 family)